MTQIFTDSPDAWKSMLDDCRSAKEYIYFEQFIWKHFGEGEIGNEFFQVFKQKAQEGVKVRLIIDSVGSIGFYTSFYKQQELRAAGVELVFFNIVPRWKARFPFSIIHRDHRKILIVDDEIAHVGGVVIWETSRRWHDIDARLVDPLYIREVKGAFLRMWDEVNGIKDHEKEYDENHALVLKTNPANHRLRKTIYKRIKEAQERIVILTPYFSPDYLMLRALRKASKRGVKVDIILPEKCDSKLTAMVASSYIWQLQRAKIGTHFYTDCMNHGKMVLIDDWVTLGSMNFDRLSFFYNRELNVVLTDDTQQVAEILEDMKSRSRKVGKEYFKHLTLRQRFEAFVGKLLRPIA